jgi:hypothetical protein
MKTKKSLLVLAVISLVFALVFTTCSNGSTGGGGKDTGSTQGQLAFERITSGENAGTWRVRKGTFKGGALVIPAYYNGSTGRAARGVEDGDPVTEIGDSTDDEWSAAFRDSGITSVEIPDTVKVIGSLAFGWNPDITSVTIPASVTNIWTLAFGGCINLKSITVEDGNPNYSAEGGILYTNIEDYIWDGYSSIPQYTHNKEKTVLHSYPSASGSITNLSNVTSIIGECAFELCTSLTSIVIPSSVTKIGVQAFANCTSLTSITILSSVTSIGDLAFAWCTSFTSITIPSNVTEIGYNAFLECTGLTNITIPESVTSIGNSVFFGCKNLTSITVAAGNSNYSAEGGILYNKNKTEMLSYPSASGNVTIPENVTSIGGFAGCENLTSITIPESVTSIGYRAFMRCTGLTSVTIPSSVTSIGNDAFYFCTSLTSITIPSNVTEIGYSAFMRCTGLTSVTIPSSVTKIGYYAFSFWTSSQTINVQGKANRAATIAAGWHFQWDEECNAKIVYQP